MKLVIKRGINTLRGTSRRLRYAPPLAVTPVQRARVLVAVGWNWRNARQEQGWKGNKTPSASDRIQGSTNYSG